MKIVTWHYGDDIMSAMESQIIKKTSKLRVTSLCEGNLPVAGGFPSQKASDVEMYPFHDITMVVICDGVDGYFLRLSMDGQTRIALLFHISDNNVVVLRVYKIFLSYFM